MANEENDSARMEIAEGNDVVYADLYLDEQKCKGHRVTVSVEVYDTKGTSKRGHAPTFAEAVEQVRAMLE